MDTLTRLTVILYSRIGVTIPLLFNMDESLVAEGGATLAQLGLRWWQASIMAVLIRSLCTMPDHASATVRIDTSGEMLLCRRLLPAPPACAAVPAGAAGMMGARVEVVAPRPSLEPVLFHMQALLLHTNVPL